MRKNKEDDESSRENDSDPEPETGISESRQPTLKKTPPTMKKTPQKRKPSEEVDGSEENSNQVSASGGRTKRRLAQCVVEGCQINENTSKSMGKKYKLFDPPKDKAGRLRWSLYVPGVDCAVHLLRYCKVCELHFVEGEPTKENPLPTQNLHPSEDFGLNKSEHESKKMIKKVEMKSDEDEESDEPKTLKIKFPAQKAKKMIVAEPPAKKPKVFAPKSPDLQDVEPVRKFTSPSMPKKQETLVSQPPAPLSVNSVLKDAFAMKEPASSNNKAPLNRPSGAPPAAKMSATFSIQQPSPLQLNKLGSFGTQSFAAPRLPPPNERNFAAARPQTTQQSVSNRDDEQVLEPCQHCGLELVEIRKDLVRMENKIDVVSTLLRSVLQRTLPAPRSTSSIVKISPTTNVTANVVQGLDNEEQSAKADVVVRKNILGKPMKFIINSHGHIAQATTNDTANTGSVTGGYSTAPTLTVDSTKMFSQQLKIRSINSNFNSSEQKGNNVKMSPIRKRQDSHDDDEDDADNEHDQSFESGEIPVSHKKPSILAKTKQSPKTSKISVVPKRMPIDEPAEEEMNNSDLKSDNVLGEDVEMSRAVARAALLFTGRGLTINHLKEYGPTWLSGIAQDEVQSVLDNLVSDGMLEAMGEQQINWPNSTSKTTLTMEIYRKISLEDIDESKLLSYGVTKRSYLASYKQKSSKFTFQLNKICDDSD